MKIFGIILPTGYGMPRAIWHQSEQFFTGWQVRGRHTEYNQASATNTLNEGLVYQVFVGYRFNAPNFLKRFVDKISANPK